MINMKKFSKLGLGVAILMAVSFFGVSPISPTLGANAYDYSAGTISGATMADLYNITFTDTDPPAALLGLSSETNSIRMGFIPHMAVRSAFSIRAAVVLMDEYDNMWEEKLGVEVFTGVVNSDFDSSNALSEKWQGYFNSKDSSGISIHLGTVADDTTGDIGSNSTVPEDSYRASIDYTSFDADSYSGVNVTQVENTNALYDDLVKDELLDSDEEDTDWKGKGRDIVTAGHTNVESATLDVMRKRIAQVTGIPSSRIQVDDYHIEMLWLEQILSQSLAEDVRSAYDDAKREGAFIDSFRVRTPIQVSRVGEGQPARTFDCMTCQYQGVQQSSFGHVDGSTATDNSLAFKDKVNKGDTSESTGLVEKVRTGFIRMERWLINSIDSNPHLKILASPMIWYMGLDIKARMTVFIITVLVIVILLFFLIRFIVRKTGGGKRRMS